MNSSDSTEAVYNRHAQAFFSRDMDALPENFTDESVIITNQGMAKGLEQVRGFYTQVLAMMTPETLASSKMPTKTIEGEVDFHTATQGAALPFIGETYVIRAGKIVVQTVGMCVPE